jgi:hypothetical protein
MSHPLEIAGQRFGKLKAIRPLKAPSASGNRQWLCQCDCENKIIVSATVLRLGRKRSCGCIGGPGPAKSWIPFTKAKMQAAHDATKRIRDDEGNWWFALREATKYLKLHGTPTLRQWATHCP